MEITTSFVDGKILKEAEAILARYELALFTMPGEIESEPDFGIGMERYIGETNNRATADSVAQFIYLETQAKFPEIKVKSVKIDQSETKMSVTISVIVIPYGVSADILRTI